MRLKEIDHNPNEKHPTNAIWFIIWPIIAALWFGTWFFFGFNWHQLALGFGTGGVLATWAIEVTGNKTPEWMGSPRRRDGQL